MKSQANMGASKATGGNVTESSDTNKTPRTSANSDGFTNSTMRQPAQETVKLNSDNLPSLAFSPTAKETKPATPTPIVSHGGTHRGILIKRKTTLENFGTGRKSPVVSVAGTTTRDENEEAQTTGRSEGQQGTTRPRSIVVMAKAPVALMMESKAASANAATTNPSLSPAKSKKDEEETPRKQEGERTIKRRARTFRLWTPKQNKKGILVKVGDEGESDETERIFQTTQMRHKSFRQWHKEARTRLPSVTGGATIENVADLINIAPTLKKEEDPRVIQQTIKRLSIDSDDRPAPAVERRKSSVAVDYTKVREVKVIINEIVEKEKVKEDDEVDDVSVSSIEDYDDEVEYEIDYEDAPTDVEEEKSDDVIIEVSSDEEERQREKERKRAGKDIKDKIKTLRELAEHLSSKREIRHSLVQKATGLVLLDTEQIPFKEHVLYLIEEFSDAVHDFAEKFVIWKKPISEINGRYGVVTASYFVWLRQMVALELFFFTITNVIIIIPQVVEDIFYPDDKNVEVNPVRFSLGDLLNGEGFFHHSYLYYTGYQSRNEGAKSPLQNPAFRFIMCMFFMFIVLSYFIFSRLARYYKSIRMESKLSSLAHMEHFKAIICGWDFSCRDPQAKVYLHKTIYRELYVLARASDQKQAKQSLVITMELQNKKVLAFAVERLGIFWGLWVIHILGNCLLLFACFTLGFTLVQLCRLKLLYYVECVSLRDDKSFTKTLHHQYLCPYGSEGFNTIILSLPALFASITTLLLTKLILIVADNEVWDSPERKIYATMIRAGLFYFTNIGVFYTFWITNKPLLNQEGFVAETIFGKELYRLVVIQGVIDVVLNFGVKGIYHLTRRKRKGYVMTEFRTEYCSLSMFFIHSVSRIGTLFCPPLGIFVTMRLVMDFYQNRFALLHLSAKENYSTHASHVYAPFLLTFFILCYLITSFMNAYYINGTTPSVYNGPFVNYNMSYDQVLGISIDDSGAGWLKKLATPGFLVVLNSLLGALLYFCHAWGKTYEPIIDHLNELIGQERADRDLLLLAIFEIGQVTVESVLGDSKSTKIPKNKLLEAMSTIVPVKNDEQENEQESVKKLSLEGAQKDFAENRKVEESSESKRHSVTLPGAPGAQGTPQPTVIEIGGTSTAVTPLVTSLSPSSKVAPSSETRADVTPTGAAHSITAPSTGSAATTEVDKTIDEQIRDVIRQVKTRRRTNTSISQPQKQFSIPVRKVDRREVEEQQKAMRAQEEKIMQKANQQMNSALGNIIENRRRMMMLKTVTGATPYQTPSKAQGVAATSQQKTQKGPPASLQEKISGLSVVKTGEVSSYANTAKRRIPPNPSATMAAKSKPGGDRFTPRKR